VVFLSNHFRAKGTDLAAEVAETLADEPFAWTFAGGAVQPDTEALLRPLGRLGSRYRRIEAVDEDVRCRLLHGSDVLLLPSRDEGSPLVVLEAMEHGVIPVVSARGCMPEVVGEVGAVCDTVEEFAEVLRLLAKDRGELAERSAEALLRWRAQYSRDAFEHRVAELLAGAAGAGSDEDGDRP
jgi:glycosyltransferase involved in cell wall biosynthesis